MTTGDMNNDFAIDLLVTCALLQRAEPQEKSAGTTHVLTVHAFRVVAAGEACERGPDYALAYHVTERFDGSVYRNGFKVAEIKGDRLVTCGSFGSFTNAELWELNDSLEQL